MAKKSEFVAIAHKTAVRIQRAPLKTAKGVSLHFSAKWLLTPT
jgi:hypothetical protein